jgi:hypothetical protein
MTLNAVTRDSKALTAAANDKGWFDWGGFWRGFTGGLPGPFAGPNVAPGVPGIPGVQGPGSLVVEGPGFGVKSPFETLMGLGSFQEIAKRVGIGLGGVVLVAIGANMISRDMGLQQAALKLGSQIGKVAAVA